MIVRDSSGGNEARRRTRRPWAAAGAVIVLGALGCTQIQPAPQASANPETYRVAPPDQLRVNILPEPAIDRTVVVRPDGRISIDLVGDVQAQGRTTEEIGKEIQSRIARYKRDAVATVSVVSALSVAVTILGEVSGPTYFPLGKDTRVVEAIGKVGGPTHFAAMDQIRVIRTEGGRAAVYYVDLDAIEAGDMRTNIVLAGGDLIYVPPTTSARIGYVLAGFFFPFQQLVGFGSQVAVKIFSGGAM